ncbi:bacteriohemerythrin [Campylobacter coli]|nr:bacteriohemerythrin [Campylobacter coli]EEP3160291.1 bacteriohemerythrin [Campylobacter coli]EFP0138569.1 bacteriohemerythrin [Campylobacter coli]EGN8289418.1 bacteriohemerythrin [Campylobacter coli]
MLPKWDKIYSVHNGKIDNQHKKLFELAAKVEHIFDKPVHRDEIKALLTDFFNYMKYHFDDEEKYIQFIRYPDFERHRQIHKEIIQSMIKIIQNIKTTNDLKEKLYIMVKKWLLEHILYEDMKVEQWRLGSLSSENGADITFEEIKDNEDEAVIYFYACECIGQIHDVPSGIHKKIQNEGAKFKCKKCKFPLEFFKKGY